MRSSGLWPGRPPGRGRLRKGSVAPQTFEFCRATVCGRFEECGRCGHADGYRFQIVADAELPSSMIEIVLQPWIH
ncbi:MAG: hypothetical protein H8D78_14315 [Chloroflexi bacterium]|nr:hypothetical protein [Chloroflexota bacterium]